MINIADITGVILCGGAGERMNGRDKPLESIAGQPMVAHVAARLRPQVGRVLISCNRNEQRYRQWCDECVLDEVMEQGPLQGVLAALDRIETPFVFICPGDAPMLSRSLISVLSKAWCDDAVDICVPHDGERLQHLFLLLRPTLGRSLRANLTAGGRSVRAWIESLPRVRVVDAAALKDSFVNINSDTDLRTVSALLRQSEA